MNVENIVGYFANSQYVRKIGDCMDDIDYRRVTSQDDLLAISELRRNSYLPAKIYADLSRPMTDISDNDPSVYVFGVFFREKLVSTVRIHILNSKNRNSNSRLYFQNVLDPLLDQGLSFMDPTRFAIDPLVEKDIPGLALITLRLGFLAAKHFECDFCLSMIKEGHGAFYRRYFLSSQITPYRQFPAFTSKYALFSSPKSMEELICARYPLFRSLAKEREMLFGIPKPGMPANLSVKPTARLAMRNRISQPELRQASQ